MKGPHLTIARGRAKAGFSLLELLVVMAIMALLAAITIPAVTSVLSSYNLSYASQSILGQLTLARQMALTTNRAVQVRFYQVADGTGAPVYRAMQSFQETTDSAGNTVLKPISKPFFLPSGTWLVYNADNTTASTLFTTGTSGAKSAAGDAAHPLVQPYGSSPYVSFRFRSTGQTDLISTSTITVASTRATAIANGLPANYATLQIDLVNGAVRQYLP